MENDFVITYVRSANCLGKWEAGSNIILSNLSGQIRKDLAEFQQIMALWFIQRLLVQN